MSEAMNHSRLARFMCVRLPDRYNDGQPKYAVVSRTPSHTLPHSNVESRISNLNLPARSTDVYLRYQHLIIKHLRISSWCQEHGSILIHLRSFNHAWLAQICTEVRKTKSHPLPHSNLYLPAWSRTNQCSLQMTNIWSSNTWESVS